ncbi:hypothetical protein U1Q18_049672, partial [Sarracenia purpurea var. burkii]
CRMMGDMMGDMMTAMVAVVAVVANLNQPCPTLSFQDTSERALGIEPAVQYE